MSEFLVIDTFAGIGGFSLGLEATGHFETAAFVEIDPYCQKVLQKHWPDVPIFGDIRDVTKETLAPILADAGRSIQGRGEQPQRDTDRRDADATFYKGPMIK